MKNKYFFTIFVSLLVSLTALSPNVVHASQGDGVYIDVTEDTFTGQYNGIEATYGPGLSIEAGDSKVDVTVNGDITSLGEHAGNGISAYSGYSDVSVSAGNISSEYYGVGASTYNGNFNLEAGDITGGEIGIGVYSGGKSNVTVNAGNVTVKETDDSDDAIEIFAYDDSSIEINTGDLKSADDGIQIEAGDNAVINITTENITTDDRGTSLEFYGNSQLNFDVNGDIVSGGYGFYADADGNAEIISTIVGDIIAENDCGVSIGGFGEGLISVSTESTETKNGDITGSYSGVYFYGEDSGEMRISADGTVEGNVGAIFELYDESTAFLSADKIEGDQAGIALYTYQDSSAMIFADVISGDEVSIGLGTEGLSEKNIDIYAWKIELNDNKNVAEFIDGKEQKSTGVADEDFEKTNIHYIIKVEQPEEGGSISLLNEDKTEKEDNVAKQNEKFFIKVNVEEGYKLNGVYSDDGKKQEVEVDDDGNYYIIIPKGGGVYLSVSLEEALIINEQGKEHEIGSGKDYVIEIDISKDKYDSTWVDEKDVSEYAIVTKGSTIVTLPSSFLDTLKAGPHNILVKFLNNRSVSSTFNTTKKGSGGSTEHVIPKTGVEEMQKTGSNHMGYMMVTLALATALVTIKKYRNNLVK